MKLRSECHNHQRKASSSSHVTNKWQIKSPQQSVNAHGCQVIRQTKAVTFYPDHFKKQYFYLSFQLWFQQSIWRLHFATRKIISFCTYSNPPPFPPPTTLGKIAVSLLTILFHRPSATATTAAAARVEDSSSCCVEEYGLRWAARHQALERFEKLKMSVILCTGMLFLV